MHSYCLSDGLWKVKKVNFTPKVYSGHKIVTTPDRRVFIVGGLTYDKFAPNTLEYMPAQN